MRRYAAALRSSAQLVAAAGNGARSAVDAATFEGPAGDATRFRASRLGSRADERADELRELADAMTREAGEIERGQHAWDSLKKRLEAEARKQVGGP